MKAIKCDRCGKYYDKPIELETWQFVVKAIVEPDAPENRDGFWCFDLCKDCQKELDEFMMKYNLGEEE